MRGRAGIGTGEALAVAVTLAVASGLRLYRLDLGWFGVDQARDVATALDIAAGRDFPSVGPTMRRVTSLGALYYYFWALPYLVWRDPIAGYWFAACLGLAALVLVWDIARRLWGAYPALIALVAGVAHPVSTIDSRVCWAPAALPAIGALWLRVALGSDGQALARLSIGRAATLGALLGLALQLHLTMAGWVVAAAILVMLEQPPRRALVAGASAFILAALPALWAIAAPSAGDAGISTLPARGAVAPAVRVAALFFLPLRVPAAFAHGADRDPYAAMLVSSAALIVSVLTWAGIVRLAGRALGGERPARVLLVIVGCVTSMVVLTPGESWYYYLDSLFPLWALGAGALVATSSAAVANGAGARRATGPLAPSMVAGGLTVAAAVVLTASMATWLGNVARAGYVPIEPTWLSLDGRPGRDAAVAGRLVTIDVKRAVAAAVAGETDFATLAQRAHGPALSDVSGDNGFWLRWYAERAGSSTGSDDGRHFTVWYRDDPIAVALTNAPMATHDIERTAVGPLLVTRYRPAIDYASCRSDGRPLEVPVRLLPHPRRYGDGTRAMPASVPPVIECTVAAGEGVTRVVAALGGPGSVVIEGADGTRSTPGTETTLCIARSNTPTRVRVETTGVPGTTNDLDLYDVPMGAGCAR